jgi:hypothetical protein
MSAVPFAEPVRLADRGYTGPISMPPAAATRRRRAAAGCATAKARTAIRRIQALMREHGITLSELGVTYALSRIHALMDQHHISIEDLRGDALAATQQPPRREVEITHCPSVGHDPRYQLPPGARVVGPFTAEWDRLRGGER